MLSYGLDAVLPIDGFIREVHFVGNIPRIVLDKLLLSWLMRCCIMRKRRALLHV